MIQTIINATSGRVWPDCLVAIYSCSVVLLPFRLIVTPPKTIPRIGLKGYWTVTVTGWLVIRRFVCVISSVGCNRPPVLVLIGMVVLIETVALLRLAATMFLATAPTIVFVTGLVPHVRELCSGY